jgi:hypothetical protein
MDHTSRWPPTLDPAAHPRLAAWAARQPRAYSLLAAVYVGLALVVIAYIAIRAVALLAEAPAVAAHALRWVDLTAAPILEPARQPLATPLAAWPAGAVLVALLVVGLLAASLARWVWGPPAR